MAIKTGLIDQRGDWLKLIKMANDSPGLLTKALPPVARKGMVPFTRKVKAMARSLWPKGVYFKTLADRNPKIAGVQGVRTRVPHKKWHPKGYFKMQFRPPNPGAAVLMEFGSYKRTHRYPKHGLILSFKGKEGTWIHLKKVKASKPIPVWRRAYANFKAMGGPRNMASSLVTEAQKTTYDILRKGTSNARVL